MLPNTRKTNLGFTLIELLVGVAILSGISILSVQMLSDTLSSRAKQISIENTSDNFRLLINTLTKAIQEATNVELENPETLKITGEVCQTIKLESGSIIQEIDQDCMPPAEITQILSKENIQVQSLTFSQNTGSLVNIAIQGVYKDNLGEHPFNYETAVVSRISL